jgi:NAD(P)-dependent dehydrogenase (short-subunit alcohol dehydrogenase family)
MIGAPTALQGKVLLVTGAGRGIGRDIALHAAASGARVVVNDLGGSSDGSGADAGPAQEVVGEILAGGGEAVASTESVAEWAGAQRMVDLAIEAFGRLDTIVNNAGILRDRIFHQMAVEDFERVVGVHLFGSFFVSRAAAPHFRRQESGTFVHMTSTSGLIGNLGQANYAAAKLGVVGLSKSIALDMARYHVRSNCVAPFAWSRLIGTIPTADGSQAARVERIRAMSTEKIAPVVVFLASEWSEPITGQILGVRQNEVYLFSQHRPQRALHRADGWTPELLRDQLKPALLPSLTPLERSQDVFSWDPV